MTLFIVQAPSADAVGLEKARFIKDGFSKPAFIFAQLWLLYHRQWLAFAIWIAVEVAVFALVAPHVDASAILVVDLLARLWLGFEGNRLRLRRKAAVTDVVEARNRDEAETIFFRRHIDGIAPPATA